MNDSQKLNELLIGQAVNRELLSVILTRLCASEVGPDAAQADVASLIDLAEQLERHKRELPPSDLN